MITIHTAVICTCVVFMCALLTVEEQISNQKEMRIGSVQVRSTSLNTSVYSEAGKAAYN